ncbi:MAG TPA: hypothetical protein PKZ26_04730 [Anaerolineaceae bacterium]|nr:hypothetical protein [Anaerolineaceae bacterium]HUM62958.1 hypothetical protein [Anaerolineaceae bacterium]
MTSVAFFTAPKPFTNAHIRIIQRNAIQSWKSLGRQVEVWLVGDEPGVEQNARELQVGYIPGVARNSFGTPRIDSIFYLVREQSQAEYLCYVNADILVFPDMLRALEEVRARVDRFLIIGRRWDAAVTETLDIKEGWHQQFQAAALVTAKLHRAAGSDYFLFPRNEFIDIPGFAVGRAGWDNWMIYKARYEHMAVVDATGAIKVIHQNHDFSHFADGKIHRLQPESAENMRLAGGRYTVFTIHDANYQLDNDGLQRVRLNRWKLLREFVIFPAVTLHCSWLAKVVYAIFNPKRLFKDRRQAKEALRRSKEG